MLVKGSLDDVQHVDIEALYGEIGWANFYIITPNCGPDQEVWCDLCGHPYYEGYLISVPIHIAVVKYSNSAPHNIVICPNCLYWLSRKTKVNFWARRLKDKIHAIWWRITTFFFSRRLK